MRPAHARHLVLFALLIGMLAGCATSEEAPSSDGRDTGRDTQTDTGATDIGETDTGETDTGETDAGDTDTGETDTGDTDAGGDLCADVDCSGLADACTSAACDPETGECVTAAAEDGTACDTDACLADGVCTDGVCVGTPVDDGTACDDGDTCTTDDVCTDGACAGAELDCTALDGACAAGACDPESGECVAVPIEDGVACDTDACVTGQACAEGVCAGGDPVDCSSSDTACGVGTCNPETGTCEAVDVEDGTACDDGGACTTDDVCTDGVCAGSDVDCSEGDEACRVGFCRADDGTCDVRDLDDGTACDDGDLCTVMNVCETGECTGTPVDCSALDDACNIGVCDPDTGGCLAVPREDGTACDDGNACTVMNVCEAGVCTGTPRDCSGLDDACNVGTCALDTGECVAAPVDDGTACDDGNACTTDDVCGAGRCGGAEVDCSGLDATCEVGVCNADTGSCETAPLDDGTTCDDGDGCTIDDVCAAGACAGAALDCSYGLTACESSTCDAELGACGPVVTADVCSVCPEGVCAPDGACVAEVPELAFGFEDGAVPPAWTTTGDAVWGATEADAASGSWSLANGDITHNQSSSLVAEVAFPRDTVLTFVLRTSTESGFDFLRLYVDGAEVDRWSGTTAWTAVSVPLAAGPHTIEWRYTKDGSVSSGADTVWIDDVRFAPSADGAAIFAAWDFEGSLALPADLAVTGDASWFVTADTAAGGANAAESGDITHNQVSTLSLTSTWDAAGTISFAYSVSSESSYDYLEFWVDGARIDRWSGTVPWTTFTHEVSAGAHTFEWRYDKDGSVSSGSDTAWVDDIVLRSAVEPTGDLCSAE